MKITQNEIANSSPMTIWVEGYDKEKFEQKHLVRADNLINLNKKLLQFKDKTTSETKELKDKISKITQEIDNLVYDLYGITDKKEREIIENSSK